MSSSFCPNCIAKQRGLDTLEQHFSTKITCRHRSYLHRRPRSKSDERKDDHGRRYLFVQAGKACGQQPTMYELHKRARDEAGLPFYAPFASLGEWEFAQILVDSGISQRHTDSLLKSDMYNHCRTAAPGDYASYNSNSTFQRCLDKLPGPRANWRLIEVTVTGNMRNARGEVVKEVVDCWCRDPVEVVADLIGNAAFADCIEFAPYAQHVDELAERLKTADESERERIFEDMANTEWWARVQEKLLNAGHPDATVAPIIIASDKTQLSTLSGDKQAWPVYLTIGNISKDVRKQPSQRAVSLLGYLPVTKLECFRESDRSVHGHRLFHFAMRQMLEPLFQAGKDGTWMTCADGQIRRVFPILAAYIADHPEQCLVCCTKENRCPTCIVDRDRRGELLNSCYRDPDSARHALEDPTSDVFESLGMRDIPEPFWKDLPYCNIFGCIVPDLLHQLHKGVFKNHLVKWVSLGREDEVDARFARIPPYNKLRIFSKGISKISQWTGNEYKQMEKVFVGIVDGLHEDARVMICMRAILDFIYLAHYPSHTLSTLQQMHDALRRFHDNKSVFIDVLGAREHFNIPKLHWASNHYIASIIDYGSCIGLSTEISERLHIDFAKLAYRASNRREYIKQMIIWLTRREKVRWFEHFLLWCRISTSTSLDSHHLYPDERALPPYDHDYREDQPIPSEDSPIVDATLSYTITARTYPALGFSASSSPPVDDMDVDEDSAVMEIYPMEVDSPAEMAPNTSLSFISLSSDDSFADARELIGGASHPRIIRGQHAPEEKPSSSSSTQANEDESRFTRFRLSQIEHDTDLVRTTWKDAQPEDDGDEDDLIFGPYRIARKPGLGFRSGRDIVSLMVAPNFTSSLASFLASEGVTIPSHAALLDLTYPVYKKFSRILPSIRGLPYDDFYDIVNALPAHGQHAAKFSTVLYIEDAPVVENIGVRGYRIARVRVLFALPPELQRLRPDSARTDSHLAFVELYTSFKNEPEQPSGLYVVSPSFANYTRKTAVIPLGLIFRSCHLIPRFGAAVDRSWESETVLDVCAEFFLNSFSDHYMYLFVE